MSKSELDIQFEDAFERASNMTQALPQDLMLRIYAYYKQATSDTQTGFYQEPQGLRSAFKLNAWMQISHLSPDEAKQEYINIINSIT